MDEEARELIYVRPMSLTLGKYAGTLIQSVLTGQVEPVVSQWGSRVPKIFISHPSANNALALAIERWLSENGWKDEYFLDFEPVNGLLHGERWQEAFSTDRPPAAVVGRNLEAAPLAALDAGPYGNKLT